MKIASLFLLMFITFLSADELEQKIKNIIGPQHYELHKNLINVVFKDKASFYDKGNLDIPKIVNKLKENGILDLSRNSSGEIVISFKTKKAPIFLIKAVNEILKSMGYGYFVTKKSKLSKDGFEWNINIQSELKPDVAIMVSELLKWGCKIVDIKKKDDEIAYVIDFENPKIPYSKFLTKGNMIESDKAIEDYWFELNEAGRLSISSKDGSFWYPAIFFFDNQLNLLGSFNEKKTKKVELEVPQTSKFVLVIDLFTQNNIKNGIKAMLY